MPAVSQNGSVAARVVLGPKLYITDDGLTPTAATRALLESIGGVDRLVTMTFAFYIKFSEDDHLKQFLGEMHTPLEVHARRIALYIAEMMGAEGNPWTTDTETRPKCPVRVAGNRTVVVASRMSAHAAAWHSVTRQRENLGKRFKLDDCRVWMRLMFWACRECGLAEQSPEFFEYFTRWVGHFIPIYESSAKYFVRAESRWSLDPRKTDAYLTSSPRVMRDVVGVPLQMAATTLPQHEVTDKSWPYDG